MRALSVSVSLSAKHVGQNMLYVNVKESRSVFGELLRQSFRTNLAWRLALYWLRTFVSGMSTPRLGRSLLCPEILFRR